MPCTLEQLQRVQYEVLCEFADFCENHSLDYSLFCGTMLGAIRHNGFIPWDDDVDVIMSLKDFKRFLKLYKKEPIDGCFLSWFTTDPKYPLYFAKLRKNNTSMPEKELNGIEMHNGIWIDIFTYLGKPTSKLGVLLQEKMLGLFQMSGDKYYNRQKLERGEDFISSSAIYRFLDKSPDWIIMLFRRLLFFALSLTDKKSSENIRVFEYSGDYSRCLKRDLFEGFTTHIFNEREFKIPIKYDDQLTLIYGDYMTPVKTHTHVKLENIEL